MRHVKNRNAELLSELFKPRENFAAPGVVKTRQRLIHQKNRGFDGKTSGNGAALTLAARKFVGPAVKQMSNSQKLHGMRQALGRVRITDALHPVLKVLPDV